MAYLTSVYGIWFKKVDTFYIIQLLLPLFNQFNFTKILYFVKNFNLPSIIEFLFELNGLSGHLNGHKHTNERLGKIRRTWMFGKHVVSQLLSTVMIIVFIITFLGQ